MAEPSEAALLASGASPRSGLAVSVADVEPEPHEYGDKCDCALCVRVRIEDMS